MSKEIAQTVGGKKLGLLFVLLAALAVFATVGSQWRGAKADVTGTDYVLTGGFTGTVAVGATSPTYTATITTTQPTLGNLQVVVTLNGNVGNIGSISPSLIAGKSAVCAVTGASNQILTCTWTGPIPTAATGTVTFTAVALAGQASANVVSGFTASDLGSAQAPQAGTNSTAAVTIATLGGTTTKTSVSVPIGGGVVQQTITVTNNSNQTIVAAGAVALADNFPAGVTVTAVATGGTGTVTFPANCGAVLPVVGSATITCTSTGGALGPGQTATMTVTETVAAAGVFTTLQNFATTALIFPVGGTTLGAATGTITIGAGPLANVELRHVNEAGAIVAPQDVFNNVRGARHTACLFTDNNAPGVADVLTPFALPVPLDLTNIQVNGGGGFAAVGDVTPSFTNPIFFTGTTGASTGASCFSWTSTAAGDQELSVVVISGGSTSSIDWDTNNDNNGLAGTSPNNADLIKEWNVLTTSVVTGAGTAVSGAGTNNVVYNVSRGLTLNPNTGIHQFAAVNLSDSFQGSHITRTGQPVGVLVSPTAPPATIPLVGVNWTVTLTGCGSLSGSAQVNTLSGTTTLNTDGSVGNQPTFTVFPGFNAANDCIVGLTSTVTFTGSEPGALGSGPGNTVTETVNISYTQVIPVKQVLLAWAGQRVILEHDWRIPPGELAAPVNGQTAAGVCPFAIGTVFTYLKGAEGPGNFISGLSGVLNGPDSAAVTLTGNNIDEIGDAPLFPQAACITRALYESEDPGEVDVEVNVTGPATPVVTDSKVAFVIYYMKINTVNLSLVSQVSKPTHNNSTSGAADYAPSTSVWDASKDAANNTADWNVSRDLLVRGRVTGWFVNSNPSGRARDASNPQNVLPADRWVMPDDWVNIAGGSALAGSFRPSYDIMFAPNNAAGLALTSPTGVGATLVTATGTGSTTSVIKVNSLSNLPVGAAIIIGTSPATIASVDAIGGKITLVTALAAAPAANTAVYLVSGVPFEGPYSLIDIPGLYANGLGGAATSNFTGLTNSFVRDTALRDGVVDWWDAPMPAANISVAIRGTGFIKQVRKEDVYYLGTPNSTAQVYNNPFYYSNVPDSPFIPAVAAGGGYLWDSYGSDGPAATGCLGSSLYFPSGTSTIGTPCASGGLGRGPYHFWTPVLVGTNSAGVPDVTVTAAQAAELGYIRTAYNDTSVARDLVVFSDNHGEFMVTANGDFKTDLTACATNALAGGKLCKPGDKVGVGTITAVADYPDFKKHFPVASNAATVNWTWGGYKDVTVEAGETDQFKYVVFHAMDRDAHCSANSDAAILLHPVLTSGANDTYSFTDITGVTTTRPSETVDFLIDSGEGIILGTSGLPTPVSVLTVEHSVSGQVGINTTNDGKQFATGVPTYSILDETLAASGKKVFPLSSLAATGQTDECQAYIKVSNSLLGILNVLTIAHNDEGNEGFDKVIDLTGTTSYTLNFRWSLITWAGADNIPVADALKGGASTKNPGGNDISAQVTAIYGWDQVAQAWLGFFPTGVNVPGANNLTALKTGSAYWIAITGPGPVTWTVTTNVGAS